MVVNDSIFSLQLLGDRILELEVWSFLRHLETSTWSNVLFVSSDFYVSSRIARMAVSASILRRL